MQHEDLSLLTDLYELTMAQTYFQEQHQDLASFSLFIRKYPPHRGYFVSCGLADVLKYLEELEFTSHNIDQLHKTGIFRDDFLEYLKRIHFTGRVRAIPEGNIFFGDEPVIEVTAPIIEAQIVETFIINQMNLQCLIASKAARCVYAARGSKVIDFSLRRAQGIDAGIKVARASYIAGAVATSNVLAGVVYGIPVSGTMAHSFVSSYEKEIEAFRAFVRSFPERSILLIDTYDTIAGANQAVQIAREMTARGQKLQGVRIDSGDLLVLGREVRQILDRAGFPEVQIIGTGGLDEFDLDNLLKQGAPYDTYGVGTKLGVSADAPWTDMAYKLVSYGGRPVLKLSPEKATLPGPKQVFRIYCKRKMHHDIITLQDETVEGAQPLLKMVMEKGRTSRPGPSLTEIRDTFREEFLRLDARYKALLDPETYPVRLSRDLRTLRKQLEQANTKIQE